VRLKVQKYGNRKSPQQITTVSQTGKFDSNKVNIPNLKKLTVSSEWSLSARDGIYASAIPIQLSAETIKNLGTHESKLAKMVSILGHVKPHNKNLHHIFV